MGLPNESWVTRHRISVENYYRMNEAGIFSPEARAESERPQHYLIMSCSRASALVSAPPTMLDLLSPTVESTRR